MKEVMEVLTPDKLTRVVVRLRAVWHARRTAIYENKLTREVLFCETDYYKIGDAEIKPKGATTTRIDSDFEVDTSFAWFLIKSMLMRPYPRTRTQQQ